MKINISIPDDLCERVDRYAARNYMTRSGAIQKAVTEMIAGYELALSIKALAQSPDSEIASAARLLMHYLSAYQMTVDDVTNDEP